MPETLNIALNVQDLNVVMNALAQRPYLEVAELIGKVQRQAQEQMNPAPAPAAVAE